LTDTCTNHIFLSWFPLTLKLSFHSFCQIQLYQSSPFISP